MSSKIGAGQPSTSGSHYETQKNDESNERVKKFVKTELRKIETHNLPKGSSGPLTHPRHSPIQLRAERREKKESKTAIGICTPSNPDSSPSTSQRKSSPQSSPNGKTDVSDKLAAFFGTRRRSSSASKESPIPTRKTGSSLVSFGQSSHSGSSPPSPKEKSGSLVSFSNRASPKKELTTKEKNFLAKRGYWVDLKVEKGKAEKLLEEFIIQRISQEKTNPKKSVSQFIAKGAWTLSGIPTKLEEAVEELRIRKDLGCFATIKNGAAFIKNYQNLSKTEKNNLLNILGKESIAKIEEAIAVLEYSLDSENRESFKKFAQRVTDVYQNLQKLKLSLWNCPNIYDPLSAKQEDTTTLLKDIYVLMYEDPEKSIFSINDKDLFPPNLEDVEEEKKEYTFRLWLFDQINNILLAHPQIEAQVIPVIEMLAIALPSLKIASSTPARSFKVELSEEGLLTATQFKRYSIIIETTKESKNSKNVDLYASWKIRKNAVSDTKSPIIFELEFSPKHSLKTRERALATLGFSPLSNDKKE